MLTGIDFASDWLMELYRIIKVPMDYSEETHYDLLIRNTTIQLCHSIQSSLGFKGNLQPRGFSSKFGWLVLQLRNIVVLVTMAANMKVPAPNNERKTPLEDPGLWPLSVLSGRSLTVSQKLSTLWQVQ
jgi:mediator of RNA polymerase II transcription subunit 16